MRLPVNQEDASLSPGESKINSFFFSNKLPSGGVVTSVGFNSTLNSFTFTREQGGRVILCQRDMYTLRKIRIKP